MISTESVTAVPARLAGMGPNFLMRVILEPLGVYLGLHATRQLSGGWLGMAAGNVVGGLACLWKVARAFQPASAFAIFRNRLEVFPTLPAPVASSPS